MEVQRDPCEETKPKVALEEENSALKSSRMEDVEVLAGQNHADQQEDSGSVRGEGFTAENMLRKVETPAEHLCVNSKRSIATPSGGAAAVTTTPTQLTIFHGGKVSVFDGIPPEKVHEILSIAAAAAKSAVTKNVVGPATTPAFTRALSFQSAAARGSPGAQSHFVRQNSFCRLQADLPIASRHSLKRFLEKRRDRFLNTNPYQASSTNKNTSETATKVSPETGGLDKNLNMVGKKPNTVSHIA